MYEIAKHEFLSWVDTLEIENLSEYETTILSILIGNFDDIASVGTASGQRAKLLGQKISELNNNIVKDLPHYEIKEITESEIERIESLDVEKFRGFGAVQNFTFDKQYTFFHGPNGSGKTSFCEALEYCMLGSIEEATARNISTEKYIIHVGEKKGQKPILKCKYSSGDVKECIPDYSKYRFGFIEKNRIDCFSHISAATTKTQTERMAALFGLSEFQEFVKRFTSADVLENDKYIKVSAFAQIEYEKSVEAIKDLETRLKEAGETLKTEKNALATLIASLNKPQIKSIEDIEKYFTDSQDGIITKYTIEAEKNKWIVLEKGALESMATQITTIIECYDEIQKNNLEILSDVSAVNFVDLFNAVVNLDADNYDKCPICLTPLNHTTVNPFDYSKNELVKFEKIELAKKSVRENAKKIIDNYERIFKSITNIQKANVLGDVNYSLLVNKTFQVMDVECLTPEVVVVFDELKKLKGKLKSGDNTQIEAEYNAKAMEHNKEYDIKLFDMQKAYKTIVEKNGSVNEIQKSYDSLVQSVDKEKKKIEELTKTVEEEKKVIEFNKKMIEAYGSIVEKLSSYVSGLPTILAQNLSDKVREYYNCINEDDADFELIKELHLPLTANEKITIEMEDGVSQDALLILSEGHVKILGLSILLAKAASEGIPFLIFDDIVNSIDDDHRNGVARLLISHIDFSEVQMILTCHGELFVSKLENYVFDKKKMSRYMFLPADRLEERGVFIKYQDASIPLMTAREKYIENQLKDCAAKCRQAVECIIGKLWRIVSKFNSGGISVSLRSLEGAPDLKSVTSALYGATKPSKMSGAENLNENLKLLISDKMWVLLNKGTHIDETIPEFDRREIKELLELIEKITTEVEELKIKPVNVATFE